MKKRSVSGCAVNPLTLNEVRRSEKLPKKGVSERSSKRVRSVVEGGEVVRDRCEGFGGNPSELVLSEV